MQIFSPRANIITRSVLVGGALMPFLAIGVTYGYMNSSYVTGQDVILEQPSLSATSTTSANSE